MNRWNLLLAGLLCFVVLQPAVAEEPVDAEALRQMIEGLREDNARMKEEMRAMRRQLDEAGNDARAARDLALDAGTRAPEASASGGDYPSSAIWSRRMGRANVQLLDVSLNALAAVGWSNANDDELSLLQAGGHDPNQRGFTLQQLELSFLGAVDPYFTGEAHLIYFIDAEGESRFEIEEAFATTTRLPFGLEEHGLQLELGHFFTEFGRLNPRHPHTWHWQDQPVVNSRFFGADGMRGPGVRAAWLTPLPWFAEIHLGVQNAKGETNPSFLANDEVFEERPIAGRPFAPSGVRGADDLVYLARLVNGFDLGDELSTQIGLSGLLGPNATGNDASTLIAGVDVVMKWVPIPSQSGWPFVVFEAEAMYRRYRADDFFGCFEAGGACGPGEVPTFLEDDVFRDWGGYAQLLWGFKRNWAVGIRGEFATGGGKGFDATTLTFVANDADPFRSRRHRISPLLAFHPTEFSRLRLQYNHDRDRNFAGNVAHSIWAGFEFSFGAHAGHSY